LTKWYLDCTCDDGTALIFYVANLTWRKSSISYSSYLVSRPDQPLAKPDDVEHTGSSSLRNLDNPSISTGKIAWGSGKLGVEGIWTPGAQGIPPKLLYRKDRGLVFWTCLAPLCEAVVRLNGCKYEGLGYVERLDIALPSWEIPLDRLCWGRFLTRGTSMTWVVWEGNHSISHVYLGNRMIEGAIFVPGPGGSIVWDRGRLDLEGESGRVVRRGALGKTVFSKVPGASLLFPKKVLGMDETKWASRGEMVLGDERLGG
jgi:hypothetical protein